MKQKSSKQNKNEMTVGQVMDTEKFQEEYAKEQEQKRINNSKK